MPTENSSTNNTPSKAAYGSESSESIASSSMNIEPSATENYNSVNHCGTYVLHQRQVYYNTLYL